MRTDGDTTIDTQGNGLSNGRRVSRVESARDVSRVTMRVSASSSVIVHAPNPSPRSAMRSMDLDMILLWTSAPLEPLPRSGRDPGVGEEPVE